MITAKPPAVKIAAAVVATVTFSLDRGQAANVVAFPSKVDVLTGIV